MPVPQSPSKASGRRVREGRVGVKRKLDIFVINDHERQGIRADMRPAGKHLG